MSCEEEKVLEVEYISAVEKGVEGTLLLSHTRMP